MDISKIKSEINEVLKDKSGQELKTMRAGFNELLLKIHDSDRESKNKKNKRDKSAGEVFGSDANPASIDINELIGFKE